MRKYAGFSFADTGYRGPLSLAYSFESEKLLNPANEGEPFYSI
jgi:hypothetical protein